MATGSKKKNAKTILACAECGERNYSTAKSQGQKNERLELQKYCPRCARHTQHKETR